MSISITLKIMACTLAFSVAAFSNEASSQQTAQIRASTKETQSKVTKRSGNRQLLRIRAGQALFRANQCLDCHRVAAQGHKEGVVLDGIGLRRTRKFLQDHLKDPEEHVARNAKAFGGEPNLMTPPNLNKAEIDDLVAYLMSLPAAKPQSPSCPKP